VRKAIQNALGITVTLLCAGGCTAPINSGSGPIASAGNVEAAGSSDALTQVLRTAPKLPREQLKAQLSALYNGAGSRTAKQEVAYVFGRTLQNGGTPDELKQALGLFNESSELAPLWERSQWHISEVGATLGQEKTVRQALQVIGEKADSEKSKAAAEYGMAQSYLRASEPDKARQAFALVRDNYPKTQYAIGAAYYLGEANIDAPDKQSQAIAMFREYLRRSPDGHFARDIVNRLSSLKGYTPSSEDHDLFGQVHFVHGEWQAAIDNWKKTSPVKHWFEYATALARLSRSSEAKTALQNGIKSHPNDANVPAAAQMLSRMGTRDDATAVWKLVQTTSPKFADQALWQLALRNPHTQALSNYQQILSKYPNSDYAPDAAWWLFWEQAKQGKSTAITAAQNGLTKYPNSKAAPRFSFWIGKLQERAKQKDLAIASYQKTANLYPANYYGYRAKARSAALAGNQDRGWSTKPNRAEPDPRWTWPDLPQVMSDEELKNTYGPTVAILAKLRQYDEAMQLMPEKESNPTLRAWLFANLGLSLDAINAAARDLHGSPSKNGRWQLSYPLLYAKEIAAEARQKGLDPLLIHGLVREESRYNTLALSHSNALGLMQLLPGTAYGVAKRVGLNLTGAADIYKPENNLRLGTHYLSYTHDRFQKNALLAVASYNGGPNAVQTWSQRMASPDYDVFVENIPFSETRDYVRKVFGSYWTYEKIY
jgi:soluble lytic murein transglycosylase